MADAVFTDSTGREWKRDAVFRSDNLTWHTGIGGRWLTIGSDMDGVPCVIRAHCAPIELYDHAIADWEAHVKAVAG